MNTNKDSYARKVLTKSIIVMVVLILLTLICLLPLCILFANATRTSQDITNNPMAILPVGGHFIDNVKNIIKLDEANAINFKTLIGYRNSAIITIGASVCAVFFSCLTAYGLVVYDFKASTPAYTFILGVMMVPVQVTSVGFVNRMLQMNLVDTYVPLIVPAIASPAVVFYMRQYMKSNFPLDIVEAARIDGTSEFRTFLTIGLPLMKPAIGVQAIFAFIANWNNFYTPSMILISAEPEQATIPMMVQSILSNNQLSDRGVKYVCIALSIIPIIIFYILLSRTIVDSVAEGGVKE